MFMMIGLLTLAACQSKPEKVSSEEWGQTTAMTEAVPALDLVKINCYSCHNPMSPSHDAIVAPPLAGVKVRYEMRYKDRSSFITAMTAYMKWPSAESSLMPGAVSQFGVMPATTLKDEEIKAIVSYLYDNQPEQPEWFNEHYKSMHGE